VLRATWIQQFYRDSGDDGGQGRGRVRWRDKQAGLPPGSRIILSPYDLDARPGVKRGRNWRGYKAHVTETCEPGRPHLITHVATTDAATTDRDTLQHRHADLAARDLLPAICCPRSAARRPLGRRGLHKRRADPCRRRQPWRDADRSAAARHQLAGRRRHRVRPHPVHHRRRRPPCRMPAGQDQPQLAARLQPQLAARLQPQLAVRFPRKLGGLIIWLR